MKNIYIILSQSGTFISRMLKFFSHDEFNHSSICVDDSFEKFYSFGRIKINNPFHGGFLIENAFTHVFGKFEKIPCMILKLPVTDAQYAIICATINEFIKNPKMYKYDFANVILANTPFSVRRKNKFFCSGFVGYVLESAGIVIPNSIRKIRPIEFLKIDEIETIYKGELKEWCKKQKKKWGVKLL